MNLWPNKMNSMVITLVPFSIFNSFVLSYFNNSLIDLRNENEIKNSLSVKQKISYTTEYNTFNHARAKLSLWLLLLNDFDQS